MTLSKDIKIMRKHNYPCQKVLMMEILIHRLKDLTKKTFKKKKKTIDALVQKIQLD
jgi:hypothetical protein